MRRKWEKNEQNRQSCQMLVMVAFNELCFHVQKSMPLMLCYI